MSTLTENFRTVAENRLAENTAYNAGFGNFNRSGTATHNLVEYRGQKSGALVFGSRHRTSARGQPRVRVLMREEHCGNLPKADARSTVFSRGAFGLRRRVGVTLILSAAALCAAVLGVGLVAVVSGPAHAGPLDEAAEHYRAFLIQDVDRTVASVRRLHASISANDLDGAKKAWIDARIGWERSEVFTSGFVPELDKEIDAWPDGVVGFHAIEAKLFGANGTGVESEVDALWSSLSELSKIVRKIRLTPQGLLNGVARLAYEVGESKVDGGESRLSGTSIDDIRNNVDGIDLAYRTIFASAIETRDGQLAAEVQRMINVLKTMLEVRDLGRLDPDRLRAVSEELVVTLQDAALRIDLARPALEGGVQ
jgi:iron uptake system component EfeO